MSFRNDAFMWTGDRIKEGTFSPPVQLLCWIVCKSILLSSLYPHKRHLLFLWSQDGKILIRNSSNNFFFFSNLCGIKYNYINNWNGRNRQLLALYGYWKRLYCFYHVSQIMGIFQAYCQGDCLLLYCWYENNLVKILREGLSTYFPPEKIT